MLGYIILIALFLGILMIIIAVMKDTCHPENQIIYRYIPKTLEEEEKQPVFVSEIFKRMFRDPSPWSGGANEIDTRNNEELNKYFISQT
jgi:hypothetical protein